MTYYGTRLSENISRREPEGYLLCLNVPVARTGTQEYLPEELGLPPVRGDPGRLIPVERPEEEVFAPATIASFEGMPVTNDHPPEGVTLENIRYLQKGHAHHIRRGTGEEADLLLADLIITDPGLIELILHEGKREISCGYMYELREENGKYVQRNIRGNHIAVVDSGRAGPRVSIKDHFPITHVTRTFALPVQGFYFTKNERGNLIMKKSLFRKLSRMARDGDQEAIEAVAEILENMTEEPEVIPVEPVAAAPVVPAAPVAMPDPANVVVGYPAPAAPAATPVAAPVAPAEPAAVVTVPEGHEVTIDSDLGAAILEKLDQLIALLTPTAVDEEPGEEGAVEEVAADPIQEIVEAVTEAVEAGAATEGAVEAVPADDPATAVVQALEEMLTPSTVLEPEEEEQITDCDDPTAERNGATADAVKAALKVVRPMVAKLPKAERAKVCADVAARIRKSIGSGKRTAGPSGGVYAALAAKGRDQRAEETNALGKRIMEKRNANYRK